MPVANNELLKEIRIMAAQLADTVNNLEQKIDKEVLEINNEIAVTRTQFTNALLEVKNELEHWNEKIDEVKAGSNVVQKSLELSISGIPVTDGENLQTKVSVIGSWIAAPSRTSLFALRRQFLSKYFEFIKSGLLLLSHIGMNDHNGRIYVNENISKQTLELLKEAKSLKRVGKISDAYVYDGQVCVIQRDNQKRFETVSCSDDLKKYE
ncbi:hypothetical protein HA402_003455 [Bradysia odoriphaga]|nr:hypothetical protein HA402_003455 [Bradysia odoriphaga]